MNARVRVIRQEYQRADRGFGAAGLELGGRAERFHQHRMAMGTSKAAGPEIFIGTSGYSYPDWRGVVYPKSVKREVAGSTSELTYLSRYFNTCEINATF